MKRLTIILLAFLLVGCEKGVDKEKEKPIPRTEVKEEKPVEQPVVTEPIEEPVKALTEEEDKYLDILVDSSEMYAEHYAEIQNLVDEAKSNPSIMKDKNWIGEIQENFTMIYMINGTFKEMLNTNNVPTRMYDIHIKAQETFALLSLAGDKIDTSLDETQTLIDESNAKFDEINDELDKLIDEMNIKSD